VTTVDNRPGVNHIQGAPQDEKDVLEMVVAHAMHFEDGLGTSFREKCLKFYRQFRGFTRWKDDWTNAGPNDKDGLLIDAKQAWGAHLHIPLSFRTIETMVPAAIAHRPRMLYLPRDEKWQANVQNVRLLVDAQQDQIDIDLPFQSVMRSGRIYGLGVGKTYWSKRYELQRQMVASRNPLTKGYTLGPQRLKCTFDDPMFEDVDVFDFMWDPYGSDMQTCEWAIHRIWLSTRACLDRVTSGAWNTASAQLLDEDKVRGMSSGQKYDEIWNERLEASGFGSFTNSAHGEQPHEILEFHDGTQVVTVLDRQVLVQDAESPLLGVLPFQVYRPTPLQKQMVGIGDLEPLEHLQRELDTLRSQRRDAATLALAAGYVYDDGAIDEDDLQFGPNAAIRVTNSSPRDALVPIQRQEVPGSGYQEEQVVRGDFDVISGINDALNPSTGGQAGTATEAQLVQAALSRRIELASRRFEIEVVRHAAKAFLRLNQRMITEQRASIRLPDHGIDMQQAMDEGRWRWVELGPGELQGEFEIIAEGGSMAARNIPQDRQDALQMMQLFGQNPYVDPKRPLVKALQLFGIDDPESWLAQAAPPVPQGALDILVNAGVNPQLIQRAVAVAQQNDPQLQAQQQQGPDQQQVDAMMQPQAATNG
jgi:hypothetical protein